MQIAWRRSYHSNNPRLLGLIFSILGLVFVVVAAVLCANSVSFLQDTQTAHGRIIACTSNVDSEDSSGCQPIFSFTTQSGQEKTVTASFSSSFFHEGDAINVRYHANNPGDAQIDSFLSFWLLPTIFGGIGLTFLVIGLGLMLFFRRFRRG